MVGVGSGMVSIRSSGQQRKRGRGCPPSFCSSGYSSDLAGAPSTYPFENAPGQGDGQQQQSRPAEQGAAGVAAQPAAEAAQPGGAAVEGAVAPDQRLQVPR